MRILLDTHALVWALNGNPKLSPRAAAVIADPANTKLVSAVSGYEVCLKHALGKFAEAAALATNFEAEIGVADAVSLPITLAHAVAAGALDLAHRDPFDRMLIGQALVERVPIVSNEALFERFGVERIW